MRELIVLYTILITLVIGWVVNIFKLFGMIDGGITAELIIRIAAAFLGPVGSIAGFL